MGIANSKKGQRWKVKAPPSLISNHQTQETMMQNIHSTNKAISELIDSKVSNLAVLNFAIWTIAEIALLIAAFITLEDGYMAAALVAYFAGALPISLEILSDELKKEEQ